MTNTPRKRLRAPSLGDFATVLELAAELGVSKRTLERWRRLGVGPPFVRSGMRLIVYNRDAVRGWLETRVVFPPRDPAYRRTGRPAKAAATV